MLGEKKNWRSSVHKKRLSKARRHSICVFTEGETESLCFSDFEVPTLRVKCFGLGGGNARHLVREVISYKASIRWRGNKGTKFFDIAVYSGGRL